MSNDIFALVEHLDGKISEVSFELLGKGRELASVTGGRLCAVLLGSGVKPLATELGAADSVLVMEHAALAAYTPEAYTRALRALVEARAPRAFLTSSTAIGMDQSAGLSAGLGWPLAAYAKDLSLKGATLKAVSQIYGGKILAETELPGDHAIVALLAGASPAEKGRAAKGPTVEEVAAPAGLETVRTRFKRLIVPEAGDVDITKEAILVSVGRGIQSQDNLALALELAEALGASVSASRPIIDQGWLPKTRQVGKSGMTVKPKLYLAVGISGAPEHLEGMRGAATIVAINTDAAAPIFGAAHYGAVADLFDVLPLLTEKVKAARA